MMRVVISKDAAETAARLMCRTVMERHQPVISHTWVYDAGVVLCGMEELLRLTEEETYFRYIKNSMDEFFDGTKFKGFSKQEYNLDNINCGRNLLFLWEQTGEKNIKKRLTLL